MTNSNSENCEKESRIDAILRKAEKYAYDFRYAKDKAAWLCLSTKLTEILCKLRPFQLEECSDEVIMDLLDRIEVASEGTAKEQFQMELLDRIEAAKEGTAKEQSQSPRPRSHLEELEDRRKKRAKTKLINEIADILHEELKN